MRCDAIIDDAQTYLHDASENVWTEDELMGWLDDGYRRLLSRSGACVRPIQYDLPGRTAWSATQEWEDSNCGGTFRTWTVATRSTLSSAYRWEAEAAVGIAPESDTLDTCSQLWELAYLDSGSDFHFRFAIPRSHERVLKVYWDDKRLAGTSVKELDQLSTAWWSQPGEPWITSEGSGRVDSFEVYQVKTDYVQAYFLFELEAGLPRNFSSDDDRVYESAGGVDNWTYAYSDSGSSGFISGLGYRVGRYEPEDPSTSYYFQGYFTIHLWEKEFLDGGLVADETDSDDEGIGTYPFENPYPTLGVGATRGLDSTERQYLATADDAGDQLLGSARFFGSSSNALTVWQTVIPSRPLNLLDTPELLPAQLHRALKYYVLARAFERPGEGYRPDLASHFDGLYKLGEGLLAILGTPSFADRVYARDQVGVAHGTRPLPYVRFPSTYPRSR